MARVTWLFLVGAFGIWLILVGGVGSWALSAATSSAAPAPSILERVAGVVLYKEPDQRSGVSAQSGMQVYDGDELVTSFGSNATLRVFDGSAFELYPDARLRVEATRIGRFTQSATQASFRLEGGAVRLSVPQIKEKPNLLRVATPHGAASFVAGEYTLRVGAESTRISVWEGRVAAAQASQTVELAAGQKAVLTASNFVVIDLLEDLIGNGDFRRRYQDWEPWEDRERERIDLPGSMDIASAPNGASALRIHRASAVDAHNETGLRQRIGRDVNGARAIQLEAEVRVDFASLSGGGYVGSEYPLMIRIRGHDARGGEMSWVRGFYYSNPENRPVSRGLRIEQGVWTTFSEDISRELSQAAGIDSIEVFGAGHTFDASISQLRLLVD